MSQVTSTITGVVWKVLVNVGDPVEIGQEVAIIESMKMEIPIASEVSGTVKQINAGAGDFVNEGDVLIQFET